MSSIADWAVAPEPATLYWEEVAVWRLPSDRPRPLETVLARYLDVEAGSLALERTPRGKPELPGSPLRFSLAHSGDVALVAVTRARDVGVDVERVRPDADRWSLVEHALTAGERRRLRFVPAAERSRAFLSMWTRKEALLKAAGVGLAVDPALVELDGDSVCALPAELESLRNSTIREIPLLGHVGSVAFTGNGSRVRLWSIEEVTCGGGSVR